MIGLARRFDETLQRLVGDIGEEIVVNAARSELRAMGRPELAREVRRVSLLSDQLGYDVSAPRVSGRPRLLEVKATTAELVGPSVNAHLSRNEADTGAALADWALVICAITTSTASAAWSAGVEPTRLKISDRSTARAAVGTRPRSRCRSPG